MDKSQDTAQFVAPPWVEEGSTFWFPVQSSTVAPHVDWLFHFILGTSTVFFLVIVGLMIWFTVQYRRRPGAPLLESSHHNTALELTWSIIPAMLLIPMFFWGFVGYVEMRTPPEDSGDNEIRVTAKRWSWLFTYPQFEGFASDTLYVEEGKPFKLTMISEDVLHSLFIPAFRVKQDVVPGRYATTWFIPTRPGEYTLFCAEYCGKSHSDMLAKVVVYPAGERAEKLTRVIEIEEKETPPLERGLKLYNRRGCAQCHTTDGTAKVGPSFKGTFGTQQKLADGSTITVDDNYIRESILEPNAKVRGGYRAQMPSFKGQLKDSQIEDLILFIKSLNEDKK